MWCRYPWSIRGDSKRLISSLLLRDPRKRLGSRAEEDIKRHDFFRSLDWGMVEAREVVPEFIPPVRKIFPRSVKISHVYTIWQLSSCEDTQNFDAEFTSKQLTLLQPDAEEDSREPIDVQKYYDEAFEGFSFYNDKFE